ncbi:uncharacterized protein isoform X2 [Rhodnius prolixus]|uniref:uncharacterized protein isoform X2 n=1 Tax=Rhodnius prolixus TaxID=13249 RepID=UPI003D18957F
MAPSPPPINDSSPHLPNTTYFTSNEDEEEPGFTEIQTVALACFLTLLPLIFGLVSYFGFRYCWGRFKRTVEPSDFGKTLDKESAERNKSSHALLNEQMKPSESQFSVIPVEEGEEGGVTSYSSGNQTSKSTANGSIITMTMKNNHLIVETEERVNNGEGGEVFVVDVEAAATSCTAGPTIVTGTKSAADNTAIVHRSPDDNADDDLGGGANTGLSQSDLSCSSNGSCNRGYSYGTQQEYRPDSRKPDGEEEFPLVCEVVTVAPTADEDIYLEQQRRLGNGDLPPLELPSTSTAVKDVTISTVTPIGNENQLETVVEPGSHENPAFLTTPEPQPVTS